MRRDIDKVVFERAKGNRSWASKTPRPERVVLDTSDQQLNEETNGVRRKRQKYTNSHVSPLKRFLIRNVGRHWSKVYSEVCASADARSFLGIEIRALIESFVATKCWFDGRKLKSRA